MKSALPNDQKLSIRAVMMPRDCNALGSIFGGHILSLIDLAAAEHAKQLAARRFVTKIVKEVNFIAPVLVGDCVSFHTSTVKIGITSITVSVQVEANRSEVNSSNELNKQIVQVTSAEVVLVAIDNLGNPISVR
jgi:acyl-CoA thioesterase YciA